MREVKEPEFCPICGSKNISTEYDNVDKYDEFREWYWVECEDCENAGKTEVKGE